MNLRSVALSLFAGTLAVAAVAGEITLTDGWEFRREGAADWRAVRVPHDWAISGPFDAAAKTGGTGKLPWKGKGEYRRTLALSADDAAMLRAGGRA